MWKKVKKQKLNLRIFIGPLQTTDILSVGVGNKDKSAATDQNPTLNNIWKILQWLHDKPKLFSDKIMK